MVRRASCPCRRWRRARAGPGCPTGRSAPTPIRRSPGAWRDRRRCRTAAGARRRWSASPIRGMRSWLRSLPDSVTAMDAWPAFAVPDLPGKGEPLRLYDTARQAVTETAPGHTARMYVCGITPYDATHLGHAATYLAFDLVQRVWRDSGHEVLYVQNVTDVDDPLLERAAHTGENWMSLAEREIQLFREDMTSLRVLPPDEYVGAVESVPEITEAIAQLLADGNAYRLDDDIYFPVDRAPGFGAESNYDREPMLALFPERGGD